MGESRKCVWAVGDRLLIEPTLRKDLIDSEPNPDFKSKSRFQIQAFHWERIRKRRLMVSGNLANNIVPSLLSFFHNSVTSHVFVVINQKNPS